MIGVILNSTAIIAGAVLARMLGRSISHIAQRRLQALVGAATLYLGFTSLWAGVSGSLGHILSRLGLVFLALTLGKLLGRILHLQSVSNRIGQYARRCHDGAQGGQIVNWNAAFITGTIVFCLTPLAVLGPLHEGLRGHIGVMLVKAVIDGIATFGFVPLLGWGVGLAALPVFAWQSFLTLSFGLIAPSLSGQGLVEPVIATSGVLLLGAAMMMLQVAKIDLTDYLPSLVIAPLLERLLR